MLVAATGGGLAVWERCVDTVIGPATTGLIHVGTSHAAHHLAAIATSTTPL